MIMLIYIVNILTIFDFIITGIRYTYQQESQRSIQYGFFNKCKAGFPYFFVKNAEHFKCSALFPELL